MNPAGVTRTAGLTVRGRAVFHVFPTGTPAAASSRGTASAVRLLVQIEQSVRSQFAGSFPQSVGTTIRE